MKYSDIKLVVLTAGKASRLYPLTFGFPKCLLSVNQKPEIFNMLNPMIRKGLRDVVFVVNLENKNLIESFMNHAYELLDLDIKYLIQDNFEGPGAAFKLIENDLDKPVMLLLGDTICEIPSDLDKSWLGVSEITKEKERYCMIEYNKSKEITGFWDKPKGSIETNKAAIGIYYLKNFKLLKKVFSEPISKIHNEYQLSSLFELYMKREKIYIKEFNEWEDIGTLDAYKEVTEKKFNCRFFNHISLDDWGILTKKSRYDKIETEIEWYRKVQNSDFGKMSPKLYDYGKGAMKYSIEYYDYLTLMEYLCYYPLTGYNIKVIFSKLFNKLEQIYRDTKIILPEFNKHTRKILIDKTYARLNAWGLRDSIDKNIVKINGVDYIGAQSCLKLLNKDIEKIAENSQNYVGIIHGDPTFSNILFSPRTQIFRFIDPRGNFDIDTIYGDVRYDIAKLRHCYHGRYDEIVNDLFEVLEGDGINYKFYKNNNYRLYDEIISKHYNLDDIELIEGLLFLSMLPLHDDYPNRQLVFFARGISCLNNQIKRRKIQ